MLCLSGLRLGLVGELGGVVPLTLGIDPGGKELGVTLCTTPTGEVFRANGDMGVCLFCLSVPNRMLIRCLNESERCGEEGSLGEGVPLDECPELSRPCSLFS